MKHLDAPWSRTFSTQDEPFAGRTGAGVRVAVIDSGVAARHPHVGAVEPGVRILVDGQDGETADRIGHGTAVAGAIHEKAPASKIVPVRVFDTHLSTTADVLARAIRWAAEHGCRLINLSLGTANQARAPLLASAVADAGRHGALIVSPGQQDGVRWLPGSLDGVFAVQLDWACERNAMRVASLDGEVNAHAAGYPRPVPGIAPERNLHGVSFAAANVTGLLARLLEAETEVRSTHDVLRLLRSAGE